MILVQINVDPKKEILDPQGKTVQHALKNLGYKNVQDVKIGKHIMLELNEGDEKEALLKAEKMCKDLFVNSLIEEYSIKIIE
jgi:phosphoribosylformylglycinamidine synthase subunit PurS